MAFLNTRKYNRAGFTIIELVIAMLVMGILIAIATRSFYGILRRTKTNSTVSSLKVIKSELRNYNENVHKYPDTLEDLVRKPSDLTTRQWGGPYLGSDDENPETPKDGWGNDFVYRPLPGNHPPFELYSWGESGPDSPSDEHITA